MTTPKTLKSFAIRNKKTGDYWKANSGKNTWTGIGAAKNAWANSNCQSYHPNDSTVYKKCNTLGVEPVSKDWSSSGSSALRIPYFDEQDVWEIVQLDSVENVGSNLKEVEALLQRVLKEGNIPYSLHYDIKKYFGE